MTQQQQGLFRKLNAEGEGTANIETTDAPFSIPPNKHPQICVLKYLQLTCQCQRIGRIAL